MDRRWIYRPQAQEESRRLAERLALSPIAAQVLLNRGLTTAEGAKSFLTPELKHLHDPFSFRDMGRAAERLIDAVRREEPILVYGDYDVDGLTGTTVLLRLLRLMGGRVEAFIPERREGFGMQPERVASAADQGYKVIVTVDNGTSAFAAARAARERGVDVIVTDHHLPEGPEAGPDGRVPEVHALLNPNVPGETYPYRDLCGAGVAFKLAWGTAQLLEPGRRVRPDFREYLLDALSYVAIGTVADLVPLAGENRAIVRFGLRALAASRNPGLRALLEVARLTERTPAPDDVAFRLAPRLNAAGRMGVARLGLELFTATEIEEARALATRLDEENRRRQALEKGVLAEALEEAPAALAAAGDRAVVLAKQGWPLGVLGIVAARLCERFYRPAILIALDGERGRGSCRSVAGIALPDVLGRCREELCGFGGHAAAAGLEIRADRVERFRERLGAVLAETHAAPAERAAPLEIDLAVALPQVSSAVVRELDRLAPYGRGNEPPLFAAHDVRLAAAPRACGKTGDHLQLLFRQDRTVVRAIGFGLGKRAAGIEAAAADGRAPLEVAFRPVISQYTGEEQVELEIRDVRASRSAACPATPSIEAA